MTDSEAEAVLVALGGRLRWEDRHKVPPDDGRLYFSQKTTEVSSYGMQWYEIRRGTQDNRFVAFQGCELGFGFQGPEYTTLAVAQAACERHYSTGKWE